MKNNLNAKITEVRGVLLCIFCAFIFFSCSNTQSDVVARVNGEKITAEEIAFAYEFAPRKITQQVKEKALKMILDGIVKKQLFAKEAKEHGLDENPEVQESIDYFTRAAINRELFLKHIRDSIIIDDESLREAYQRSKEVLFVKHFLTPDKNEAIAISNGEMDVEHCPLTQNTIELSGIGIMDKITFNQIDQRMEDVIFELPLLQLSEPFFDGKYYHVFRVMDKSIDKMQTEEDFQQNRESLATALQKRAEHRKAFEFVNRIMAPQKLIIKADAMNWMIGQIQSQSNQEIKPRYLDNKELESLDQEDFSSKNIAEFKSGNLTVNDFHKIYRMNPIEISLKNENSIRESLKNIIAIYVRDKVFSDMGIAEQLDQKESVKQEQKYWETRLLANEMKRKIYDDIKQEFPDSVDQKYESMIEEFTQELYTKSNIKINNEKLLAIKTSDEGLSRKIDFFAKHLQ